MTRTREELADELQRLADLIQDPLETRTWPSDLAALALDNLDMICDALNDVQVMVDEIDELRAGADHLASNGFHGIAERIRIAADKLGRLRWEALREPPEPTAEEVERALEAYHEPLWPRGFSDRWHNEQRALMRAALRAALEPQP